MQKYIYYIFGFYNGMQLVVISREDLDNTNYRFIMRALKKYDDLDQRYIENMVDDTQIDNWCHIRKIEKVDIIGNYPTKNALEYKDGEFFKCDTEEFRGFAF